MAYLDRKVEPLRPDSKELLSLFGKRKRSNYPYHTFKWDWQRAHDLNARFKIRCEMLKLYSKVSEELKLLSKEIKSGKSTS